ncbi:MAG: prepilin-type N-terminal cleavage/methylation domain-containing protein [Patescibacteria group bacterium]
MKKAEQKQKRDVRVEHENFSAEKFSRFRRRRASSVSTRTSLFCFCSAFTLMEVMIVITITTIIATISIISFVSFSRREALDASATALASGLRDARSQTLASVGGSQYGIAINSNKFTLFQGVVYDPMASTNKSFDFSSYVLASSSISAVVFQRLTGNSTASGTIDVYLVSDSTVKRSVSISSTGLVNVQK